MPAMAYDSNHYEDSEVDDDYDRNNIVSPGTEDYDDGSPTDSEPPSNLQTPTAVEHPGIRHGSPSGLITQWTAEQCADFVTNLGFGQYADAVIEESIDGEALIAVQHGDLKDMGIASAGHRLTILKAVYQVKLKQNVPIDPDHYVPLSADANAPDAHATQDDVARIINQIKLRDERILQAETDLRAVNEILWRLQEDQRKFREDVLPAVRLAKDRNQPLPTPDGQQGYDGSLSPRQSMQPEAKSSGNAPPSLTRKLSQKKHYLGGQGKMPSPTIHETANLEPSAAAMQASSHLTASMNSNSNPSSFTQSQQSPTSPPPRFHANTPPTLNTRNISRGGIESQPQSARTPGPLHEDPWTWSQSSTVTNSSQSSALPLNTVSQAGTSRRPGTASQIIPNPSTLTSASQPNLTAGSSNNQPSTPAGGSSADTNDPTGFMKSFRVSMEEPCHKVLPVALKKYHINDDWRQYSLYIVHGDQERCLGLDERPLILFKQLASEGKKPMFMLRKHATPMEGFATRVEPGNQGQSAGVGTVGAGSAGVGTSSSGAGGVAGGGGGGSAGFGSVNQQGRVQSYASTMQLPGGVL